MRGYAKAAIRHRKGPFAGMFVAVLVGAALVTALGVLLESGVRAGVAPQRYAGAAVVVGAPQAVEVEEDLDQPFAERVPLPADTVAKVAAVPGVATAVGDVTVSLALDGMPVAGHAWESAVLTPMVLAGGAAPGPDEVVLDANLARGRSVGDEIVLVAGARPVSFTVAGVTDKGIERQPALYLANDRVRELYGRDGQVDTVGVVAEPGVDAEALAARIETAAPGLVTYTGDGRGDVEFLDVGRVRGQLIMLTIAFTGTAIMIVVLVVASTLALSVQQRRREFALLRAVAATPRQIHRMIGSEIYLVAGIAAVLGAVPGIGLAYLLRAAFAETGMLPADFGLALSPLPAVAGAGLSLPTARLAGFVAARRVARIRPVEALGEAEVGPARLGRGRLVTGIVALVLGIGASVTPLFLPGETAVAGASGSAFLMVLGIALLGPRLVAVAIRVVGGPLRRLAPVGGYLAVANVSASARRLAVAVTPLVLAVTLASVQIFAQTTVSAAAADQADRGVVADFVVSAPTGLAPEVTDAVRRADGVATATPVVRSQVFLRYLLAGNWEVTAHAAQGLDPSGLEHTLDLEPRAGRFADLRGDTVALSQMLAETAGAGVGDRVELHLGDGVVANPEVVAIYGRGLGFGDVTLPRETLAAHTTTRFDQSVLVAADDVHTAQRSLAALGFPGLTVTDRGGMSAAGQAERDTQSWTSLIALFVILGYVAIAVVNTLVMATAARGREFALLRLVGTGPRQVRRMTFIESLVVIGVAVVVGTVAALPPLVGLSLGMTESAVPSVSLPAYLGIVGGTALLALPAIGVPTRLALRTRPVDAL